MRNFVRRLSLFLLLFSTLALCCCDGYKHATIPEVNVNFTIHPNDAQYAALNHVGGYMYFTGGVAGIIIYRLDVSTFLAYDRACPYDWDKSKDAWICVEESGLTLADAHCGSRFNILDGGVISGPAQFPLKTYKTRYDGMILRVYN